MQGEAVLGLEAAARGLTGPGTKWLNLVAGPYASWFGDWLRDAGGEVITHEVPYDQGIDPRDVERILAEHGDIECVAVVHCETPSGMLNPLQEISEVVHAHGALIVADTVATFATSDLLVDEWQLDVAVVAPHKGLGATPGISIVSVSPAGWEKMFANPAAPRGSFLSLLDWKTRWIDSDRTEFLHAPSVSEIVALDVAVDELIELGGIPASIARHARAARATRAGLEAMGLRLWATEERFAANCSTAVRCPDGLTPEQVVRHIREHQGVMLSMGRGSLKSQIICIGHMGLSARSGYPQVAVESLGRGLVSLGAEVDVGAGVAAVSRVMSEPLEAGIPA
jgi:pyridoxamine--pyruvate transaminase